MNTDMLRQYAETVTAIRAHEDQIDALKARKAELEPQIIEECNQEGVNQVRIDGSTLYLKRTIYAVTPHEEGKDKAVEVLKASAAYKHMVKETINSNTLSSIVKEKVEAGEELPAEWQGIIEAGERWSVGVRKA